jgi:DNA-binding HxlR family transcriptional regulator
MRAGAVTVGLLQEGIQVQIMRAMAGGFKALHVPENYQGEARPQPRQEAEGPVNPEHERKYAITPTGRARLPVADSIELWLLKASGGPLPYDHERAEEAIKLLSQAWGMGIAHRLAFAPATAEELVEAAGMPRRKGRRLLKALQRVGLVEVGADTGDRAVYAPTAWLRRGIAPILRAAEVEHYDPPSGARPLDATDFESAMLLAAPLAELGGGQSGRCRLVARIGDPGQREPAGVTVEMRDGAIVACERGLDPDVDGEASGIATAWYGALSDQRPSRLRYDGDRRLARDLVTALGWALFDEQAYAH